VVLEIDWHSSGKCRSGSGVEQGKTLFAAVRYENDANSTPGPDSAGVWRSVDTAATWTFAGNGLPADVRINNIIGRLNFEYYLGTANHGLYHSLSGLTWDHDSTVDITGDVRVYSISGAILAAVTGWIYWYRLRSENPWDPKGEQDCSTQQCPH